MLAAVSLNGNARKRATKLSTEGLDTIAMTAGSITVCSPCVSCNKGYNLEQVVFSGFEKKAESTKESFFITNNTDRPLIAVDIYIEYLTMDDRQLHKRYLSLTCDIPAGETRNADIKSWDTQKSFYYYKSGAPARRKASPFKIKITTVSYNLRQ